METNPSTSQLVSQIKAKSALAAIAAKNPMSVFQSKELRQRDPNLQTLSLSEKKTPTAALYDRLNDGTYIAKYENYLGATGNENRLAEQQSTGEKWLHGLTKAAAKTGIYAFDSIVGTAYGIAKGAVSGDFNDVYDNDLTRTLDDANKRLDNNLNNYYSDDEKSKNILQSMGTANFWANDVAGGLAFVGGAILPEIAIGALSGGASLGTSAAKFGVKAFGKSLAKEGLKATSKNVAKATLRNLNIIKTGKTLGDAVKTGAFLARTANFEAGMEARQNFKDAVDNYYTTFEKKNGRTPTYEESKMFMQDARKASNGVYGANMALLTVSNAVMFGKKLLPTAVTNKFGALTNKANTLIGLGTKKEVVEGVVKTSMKGANRAQKILGNAYLIGKKPITEGVWEEGLQGVAGKTMQNYLDAKYNNKNVEGFSTWSAMHDAFTEQYGSNEGWKEMGIGMIIGLAGGGMSPGAIKSGQAIDGLFKSSRKSIYSAKEKELGIANQGLEVLAGLNRTSAAQAMMTGAIKNGKFKQKHKGGRKSVTLDAGTGEEISQDFWDELDKIPVLGQTQDNVETTTGVTDPFQDIVSNYNYIKSQDHIKTPAETAEDFNTTIDNLDLSQESNPEMFEALQSSGITEDEYKEQLKNNFKTHLKNYRAGKDAVIALGLDSAIKNTPGNLAEIGDALHMQIMAGKGALEQAREIGKHIDKVVGTNGIFDYYQHYNGLSEQSKQSAKDLSTKKRELKKLQTKSLELGNRLAGITRTNLKSETVNKKRNTVSEQAVVTQERIISLEQEISDLSAALEKDFRTTGFNLTGTIEASPLAANPIDTMAEIDKMDDYIESLRKAGKSQEANSMESIIGQFKAYQFAHREMVNGHRQMMDTNFFSSTKGKKLIDKIIGPKYSLSEEAREDIKKGNDLMDRSLKLNGIQEDAETAFKKAIAENDDLSDREKHRYESIIRMQLASQAIRDIAGSLEELTYTVTAEPAATKSPLKGDTVALQTALNLKEKGLDNLEALNKAIEAITDELDYVVNYNTKNQNAINKLTAKLEKLKEQKALLEEELNKPVEETETTEAEETPVEEGAETVQENAPISDTEQAKRMNTIQSEIDKLDGQISDIENQIKELGKDFKIVESEDFKRYEALSKKNEQGNITPKEIEEFISLKDDIDQWTFITGVVAEGFRLSDLVQQKSVLENTPIASVTSVVLPTTEDTLDAVEFPDVNKKANYSYGLTYDKVVSSFSGDDVIIHNLTSDGFTNLLNGVDVPFTKDEQNNIVFDKSHLNEINANSNLRITAPEKARYHSVVLRFTPAANTMTDNDELSPLRSDLNASHNIEAVYEADAGDKVTVTVDMNNPWNQDIIQHYESVKRVYNTKNKPNKKDKAALEEALDKIRKSLNMQASIGGKAVATFKGRRSDIKNENTDKVFEQMRNALTDNVEFLATLARPGISVVSLDMQKKDGSYAMPEIRVKQVLLGFPNYNYSVGENNETQVESRQIADSKLDKIVDIGFSRKGKTFTRDHQTVNTTFLKPLQKNNPDQDIPFVVLLVGGKRIAYPVTVVAKVKEDVAEFTEIYNNKGISLVDKANALNRYMASKGIDIKQKGNAFISFGETNITDDFFNDKVAQLEAINYFYEVEDWIKPESNVKDIVQNQITIDIDVANPFHSPKLSFDYSNIDVKPTNVVVNETVSKSKTAAKAKDDETSSIFKC